MESIEKLRNMCAFSEQGEKTALAAWKVKKVIDEIEREIAERYMLLPVDAEGVPIHYGDTLEHHSEYGDYIEKVCNMEFCERIWNAEDWLVSIGIWVNPSETRHAKPRTIEDVLTDFGNEIACQGHQVGLTGHEIIMKYADELRSMVVRDE